MAVLSTGDATAPDTNQTQSGSPSNDDGGSLYRGARDVTSLKLRIAEPSGDNCMALGFDFFTDEIPMSDPGIGSFVDGFIAELDPRTAWTITGNDHTAPPADFAHDANGNMIDGWLLTRDSGYTADPNSASFAFGTPYNVATGWLYAFVPLAAGAHTVKLTIFDRKDPMTDSSVLLDNLRFLDRTRAACPVGGGLGSGYDLTAPKISSLAVSVHSKKRTATATFTGKDPGSSAPVSFQCKLDSNKYFACASPKTYQNLTRGWHRVSLRAVDATGNIGQAATKSFKI
jgi:hypothetical protein